MANATYEQVSRGGGKNSFARLLRELPGFSGIGKAPKTLVNEEFRYQLDRDLELLRREERKNVSFTNKFYDFKARTDWPKTMSIDPTTNMPPGVKEDMIMRLNDALYTETGSTMEEEAIRNFPSMEPPIPKFVDPSSFVDLGEDIVE